MSIIRWFKKLDKYTQAAILIISLGVLIRFAVTFFVYPSGDSCWHLAIARFMARENTIPIFEPLGRAVFWAPPFFHLVAAAFYKIFSIFGDNTALNAMKFISPIFGSLTLIVFYRFTKDLTNNKIAAYSLIFLAFIPIHMYYSTISHIGSIITFFVVFTAYLLYKKRFYLSAVFCGIGILTKYSMFFIFPLLVFLIYRNYKDITKTIKRAILYFAIAFAVGLPWYIRNMIHLGTPFYPFLNSIFSKLGLVPLAQSGGEVLFESGISNISISYLLKSYLDLFGVPLGLVENLVYFPFKPYSIMFWAAITLLFFSPLVIGMFSLKERKFKQLLGFWIIPYILMMVAYVIEYPDIFLRLFLPAVPGLAILWGFGFERIRSKKIQHFKNWAFIVIILCVLVFVAGEFVKVKVAADQHTRYKDDFEWAKDNLPSDAMISPASGTNVYYIDRFSIPLTNKTPYDKEKVYYWVEDHASGDLPENTVLIYENKKTGIKIFKLIG